jgi:hypothetical protein
MKLVSFTVAQPSIEETMSDQFKTDVSGNVERLIQIGEVHGDVYVLTDKAIRAELPQIHADFASDVTDFIRIFVKSNRFGRKVEFRVPYEMTARAFIDLATKVLGLPWSSSLPELMISFDFRYSVVFNEKTLSLSQTLKDADISDGSEVHLSIKAVWTDKIAEAEQAEREMGQVMYEMGGRMKTLAERETARAARGRMTQSKVKSLADELFRFIDAVPES